jgi:hypothetical protein
MFAPEPLPFYFNGEAMPAWGACRALAGITDHLRTEDTWDEDYGHRDVWIIACRIDNEGCVESADPLLMTYVVQEVLLILLRNSEAILLRLRERVEEPQRVHDDLVKAALEMRRLIARDGCAFWTSGGEEDRVRCLEWMAGSRLSPDDPCYRKPPHQIQQEGGLESLLKVQKQSLHALAQAGRFGKELRRELYQI